MIFRKAWWQLVPRYIISMRPNTKKELGRDRSTPHEGYVSRPMDLDILYWGDGYIADGPHVIVPHPRLHQRRFTLLPLCDVAPDYVHPVFRKTNHQLLDECQDQGIVKIL